jgi:hypothetical protein
VVGNLEGISLRKTFILVPDNVALNVNAQNLYTTGVVEDIRAVGRKAVAGADGHLSPGRRKRKDKGQGQKEGSKRFLFHKYANIPLFFRIFALLHH